MNHIYKEKIGKLHPKLSEASERLIFKYPYYADILLQTNFHESEQIGTAGVNCSTKGFNFYYNPKFIDSLPNNATVMFLVIHEIFHLLFSHPARTKKGGYNHYKANVAQDCIINSVIVKDIQKKEGIDFIDIPFEMVDGERRNTALFIPKEYKGKWVFEELYAWFEEQVQEQEKNQPSEGEGDSQDSDENGSSDGDSDSQDSEGSEKGSGKGGKPSDKKDDNYGKNGAQGEECYDLDSVLDNMKNEGEGSDIKGTLDEHIDDDVPQEVKEQMIKDVVERIKNRGYDAGNFFDTLDKLRVSKKDYLRDIKRGISELKGKNKSKTWQRLNRKNLPIKGFKKLSNRINMILDTSGSMHGYYEKALGYVFQNDIEINCLQIDTKVHDLGILKSKHDIQKMKLNGGGGTVLQPAVDIVKEKYNKFNTVVLTDGYTDSLDFSGVKGKVLIISVDSKTPVGRSNGKIKNIVVKD